MTNRIRQFVLLAVLIVAAVTLAPVSRAAPPYPAVVTPDGRQLTSTLNENLPMGVTFFEGNAMATTSLRASVVTTINSVKPRDSTIVLRTQGASVIGCWLYVMPDSGAHSDSTRVGFFGITPKVLLTDASSDSGSAAVPGVTVRDTTHMRLGGYPSGIAGGYAFLSAGLNNESGEDIAARLLPGEFLVDVPLYAANNNGQPRAKYFTISAADVGGRAGEPLPPNLQIVVRFYGHTDQWPPSNLIRLPSRRVVARMAAWGLR